MEYKTLRIEFNDGSEETVENVTDYRVTRLGIYLAVRTQVSETLAEKRFYELGRIKEYKESII